MPKSTISVIRLYVILAVILLVLGAVSWRLFNISILRHEFYADTAAIQASFSSRTLVRGDILLSDHTSEQNFLVATNRRFMTVAVVPVQVSNDIRDQVIAELTDILSLEPDVVDDILDGSDRRRILARRIGDDAAARISDMSLPGVELIPEIDRSYPAKDLAADVIGFFGYTTDGRAGQYGVEAAYEPELSGTEGVESGRWGFFGNLSMLVGRGEDSTQSSPHDIILTLDRTIQAYTERTLIALMERYDAASGTIVVQEPQTGRILALADAPTFTPDAYGSFSAVSYQNGALIPFEPGSSFKPFTMAMGLTAGVIQPETTFIDNRNVVVDGYTIKNFNGKHFGLVTMTEVLEKSINIGMMYVQSLLSRDDFLRDIVDMGFGQKSDIDLPSESPGNLDNLYTGRRINFMTASFGQGITATPIQLVTAYSAIANGGRLMRPYVVSEVRDEWGTVVRTESEVVGTPFTEKIAHQLRDMLVSVVDNGFDNVRIARYDVAGKTGTAQIASPEGGYLEGEYNHSFVGFAPASNPRFTILIKLERPQGITYAADSLSPAFRDLASFLLNYLNVSPTR